MIGPDPGKWTSDSPSLVEASGAAQQLVNRQTQSQGVRYSAWDQEDAQSQGTAQELRQAPGQGSPTPRPGSQQQLGDIPASRTTAPGPPAPDVAFPPLSSRQRVSLACVCWHHNPRCDNGARHYKLYKNTISDGCITVNYTNVP